MALLELKGVKRSFANGLVETVVLKGIDLEINEGEFVSIMGPSGSGKSTILNIVGCLDKVSEGTYKISGTEVKDLTDNQLSDLRNREIGFVFQSFHLLKNLTAMANVELPLVYRGVGGKERHAAAIKALERVGLGHRINHYPKQMSGGEQQRVAIARALVGNPHMILADEPTGALDSKTGEAIMELFTDLNRDGLTIVQVTHDVEIGNYGSKIVSINDGLISKIEVVDHERRKAAIDRMSERSKQYQESIGGNVEELENE